MLKPILNILTILINAFLLAWDKIEVEPLRSWIKKTIERGDQRLFNTMNEGLKLLLLRHVGYFKRIVNISLSYFAVITVLRLELKNVSIIFAYALFISLLGWKGLYFMLVAKERIRALFTNEIFLLSIVIFLYGAFRSHNEQIGLTGFKHLDQAFLGENYLIWAFAIPIVFIMIGYVVTWLGATVILVCLGTPLFRFQILLFVIYEFASPKLIYSLLLIINFILMAILKFL